MVAMRKRKSEEPSIQPEPKVLDVNASMKGTLRFEDPVNLRINGKFDGTLDTKGLLMIGQKAEIKANITGETVSIAGNVEGNITASKVLNLDSTANLTGDVETPRIAISEGAVLNGQLNMTGAVSEKKNSRGDWLTTVEVAVYLEVDEDKVVDWANNGMLPGTMDGGEWIFDKARVDQWIADGKVKV